VTLKPVNMDVVMYVILQKTKLLVSGRITFEEIWKKVYG
jgi:hypothetical protein